MAGSRSTVTAIPSTGSSASSPAESSPTGADEWRKLLDSPNRVVFEVTPEAKPVSHDQRKIPGNGRGLAQDPEPATAQDG